MKRDNDVDEDQESKGPTKPLVLIVLTVDQTRTKDAEWPLIEGAHAHLQWRAGEIACQGRRERGFEGL